MNGALNFVFTADEWIDLAFFGHLVQVLRELLQGRGFFVALTTTSTFFTVGRGCSVTAFAGFWGIAFANTVRNEVHHIQTRNALLVQIVNSVRVFFTKNRHQHVGAGHFFFATARRLNMHDGTLNDTLKTQSGLRVNFFSTRHLGRIVFNE